MMVPDPVQSRMTTAAEDLRRLLEAVLEQSREGRWQAASRQAAALVDVSRRLQNEVDFCSMNEWLERAKSA